jgi:hypothetical protein
MSFRPPVIISTGQSMLIRFHANGGTDYGYKAKVSFLTLESSMSSVAKPFTSMYRATLFFNLMNFE